MMMLAKDGIPAGNISARLSGVRYHACMLKDCSAAAACHAVHSAHLHRYSAALTLHNNQTLYRLYRLYVMLAHQWAL